MQEMMNFTTWFLEELCTFFLSDPIKYLLGFVFLSFTITLFYRLINIK